MKICFVVPAVYSFFEPKLTNKKVGGAERQVYYLAKELAKDPQIDVNLCVADFGQSDFEQKENINIWKSFEYQENKIIGLWKLYKTLRKINADVYIFRAADAGVFFGVLIAKFLQKKTLYMIAHDAEIDNLDLKNMTGTFSAYCMNKVYPLINTITAQSIFQKDGFKKEKNIQVKAVIKNIYPITTTIPQSTDSQRFTLWVGRLVSFKKAELYLELAEKFPQEKFKMIAPVSNEEIEYGKQIQTKAKQIPNLELIDFVSPNEIKSYYQQAKIYVTTSYMEGFSNTMMEAMEAQKPILSWNVNPDKILDTHKMGFCAYENTTKFYDFFEQLKQNAVLCKTMGEAGRHYLEKEHSQAHIVNEFKTVLLSD